MSSETTAVVFVLVKCASTQLSMCSSFGCFCSQHIFFFKSLFVTGHENTVKPLPKRGSATFFFATSSHLCLSSLSTLVACLLSLNRFRAFVLRKFTRFFFRLSRMCVYCFDRSWHQLRSSIQPILCQVALRVLTVSFPENILWPCFKPAVSLKGNNNRVTHSRSWLLRVLAMLLRGPIIQNVESKKYRSVGESQFLICSVLEGSTKEEKRKWWNLTSSSMFD